MLQEDLEACRAALGPPGPARTAWVKRLPRLHRPRWAKKDALGTFFAEWAEVLMSGPVAWGALVQANTELFDAESSTDAPGELLHPVGKEDGDPAELSATAHALFDLRNAKIVPPELEDLKTVLNDELTRSFGREVPGPVAPSFPVAMTTVIFRRSHLPGNALRGRIFPVVLPPEGLQAVVPLPSEKWPKPLRRQLGAPRATLRR